MKAKKTVTDIFQQIVDKLKFDNYERWAAKKIQYWWRVVAAEKRHQEYLKWLPIDIDPDNCDFKDVDRVLKVLDDYALKKLGVLENQP